MTQKGRLAGALLILVFLSGAALADGKVFVTGTAKVRIPDQSALIVFDGKTERLVIETAAEGEGQDFAWVVPLPAQPKIEPVSTGIFPTLRVITRPRVVGYGMEGYALFVFAAISGAILWANAYTKAYVKDLLAAVLVILILAGLLLPALAPARGGARVRIDGVRLLERNIVGSYETTTISGDSGDAVRTWLEANGYRQPPGVGPILDDYARSGWVFVAAKLRRDQDSGRFTPHPLSFTFPTDKAVYPLRLTGLDNGPLELDLYVAGDREARTEALERKRSGPLTFPDGDWPELAVPVFHEGLAEMLKGQKALTLLSGRLTPEQMKGDLTLDWRDLKPYRRVYRMRGAALSDGAMAAGAVFFLLSVGCAIRCRRRYRGALRPGGVMTAFVAVLVTSAGVIVGIVMALTSGHVLAGIMLGAASLAGVVFCYKLLMRFQELYKRLDEEGSYSQIRPTRRALITVCGLAVVVGAGVYLALPKIPDSEVSRGVFLAYHAHAHIVHESGRRLNLGSPPAPLTTDTLRATVQTVLSETRDVYRINPLTGLPIREEDSPGNYTIGLDEKGQAAYYFYDPEGRKQHMGP